MTNMQQARWALCGGCFIEPALCLISRTINEPVVGLQFDPKDS